MRVNIGFLFLIWMIASFQVHAQRALYKPQAHEISLQLGGVDGVFPFIAQGEYDGLPFAPQLANGIRYTHHLSLTDGIRVGFFNRTARLIETTQDIEARRVERQLQLGYERKYHNGPHQFSFGPEILLNAGYAEYPTGGEQFAFQSIGAAFSLGYSYFISTYISAGIEGSLFYTNPSYSRVLDNPNAFPAFVQQDHLTGITAGIWLNFHFVKMKKKCKCPSRR